MVYLQASPMGEVHWNSICAHGRLASGATQAYCYGGHFQQWIANYRPQKDCWSKRSRSLFPTGRWACLQWHYEGAKNHMSLVVDGTPVAEVTVNGFGEGCHEGSSSTPWVAPAFDSLRLGWENYQASPIPIQLWMDDVAVGAAPIACPANR